MKNKYLLLLLFLCTCAFSQTMTEKYNSILGRYEYFDGQGNLTGYKVYDSLFKEWKYYQVEVQSYERKPVQYAKPPTDDNFALLQQVANQKQNSYNSNHKRIEDYLSKIQINIYEIENLEIREKVQNRYSSEIVAFINNKRYDVSNNSITDQVLNFIYNKFSVIQSEEFKKYNDGIETRNKLSETKKYNDKIEKNDKNSSQPVTSVKYSDDETYTVNEGKLRSEPYVMADVIKYIPSGKTVKVIGKKGDYYKVFYDGDTGYINEMYLKKTYNMSILSENNSKNSSQPVKSVKQSNDETYTVNEGKLRSEPYVMADVIKYIPSGKTVRVIGKKGDYYKVFYDGDTGYINEMYLKKTYNMSRLSENKK